MFVYQVYTNTIYPSDSEFVPEVVSTDLIVVSSEIAVSERNIVYITLIWYILIHLKQRTTIYYNIDLKNK